MAFRVSTTTDTLASTVESAIFHHKARFTELFLDELRDTIALSGIPAATAEDPSFALPTVANVPGARFFVFENPTVSNVPSSRFWCCGSPKPHRVFVKPS